MTQRRMIVVLVLALLVLALAACAVRDSALDESRSVEVVTDGYVLVVLRVEDAVAVEGAVVVRGLSAGDQVEVWSESGAEVVWRGE